MTRKIDQDRYILVHVLGAVCEFLSMAFRVASTSTSMRRIPAHHRIVDRAGIVVSNGRQWSKVFTPGKFGTIDSLVNNAGTGQFVPSAMIDNDEYDRVMEINARGIFFFSRAVLPTRIDKDYGKIINITSIMGEVTSQGPSVYNTGKGAAKMMTRDIAVGCSGYHVNAVAPGMVLTGLAHNILGDQDQVQYFLDKIS